MAAIFSRPSGAGFSLLDIDRGDQQEAVPQALPVQRDVRFQRAAAGEDGQLDALLQTLEQPVAWDPALAMDQALG